MRTSIILPTLSLLALAAADTGRLGDAEVVTNNPIGASYEARLPNIATTDVRGVFIATSNPSGRGVDFQITLDGLPSTGGPFMYHIHDAPIPPNGTCAQTLAHQDPYIRGEETPCDATAPQTCQVGDLSGKHGNITSGSFHDTYTDLYASLVPGLGSFFGNRSVVVHFSNKTRITCANFQIIGHGAVPSGSPNGTNATTMVTATATASATGGASGSATATPVSPSAPAQQTTNAAVRTLAGSGAVLAALAAFVL
ncbi:hypothetical protein H2201_001199 [Coniosporium apollinis]|uniref:Superoxide dismutase copper/zinc binding domain-containing protein n=1 Tax=Coniosporium apollinis TaxID=61459 RepID=A0ABQ9P861_9PEZI|nr:hypothetical protein H2201_001199 [Coniosporium apollinis]